MQRTLCPQFDRSECKTKRVMVRDQGEQLVRDSCTCRVMPGKSGSGTQTFEKLPSEGVDDTG